jgi:CHAT domain-containing protein
MKGARAVLASLWPLMDRSAARFSDGLYRELLAGRLPAEALANVQRKCIEGKFGPEMRKPERWGA